MPSQVRGDGQGRGNSGIPFNGMYEVQVLDNYNSKTYHDGQCGAMYGQTPLLVTPAKHPENSRSLISYGSLTAGT
jgi:hypothetical protein